MLVLCNILQVVSVDFHPFFRNKKSAVKKTTYYTNYVTATCPEDIFAQSSDSLNEVMYVHRHTFLSVYPFLCTTMGILEST